MSPGAPWNAEPYPGPEAKLARGEWLKLCPLTEVAPGSMREVEVTGLRLLVILSAEGEVAVTGAYCPHEDVALVQGVARNGVLRCFEHGYGFDLKTGACDLDEDLCLPVYPSRIAGDWVEAVLLT